MRSDTLSCAGASWRWPLAAVLSCLLLVACGSQQNGTQAPAKTGAVAFTVEWEPPPDGYAPGGAVTTSLRPMAPVVDVCTDYGIDTVTMKVLSGDNVLASAGYSCAQHGGMLNNITVGNNLVLRLEASVPGSGTVVWAGDTAFTLAAGETKDVGKVTMSYTGDDNTPPTVLSGSPTDNATHVLNNSTIRVQFSEKMAVNTVQDSGTIVVADNVSGPVPGVIVYNPTDYSAVFTPAAPLASGAKISVSVTNVATDMAGNKLGAARTWSFIAHVPGEFGNPFLLESNDITGAGNPQVALSANGDGIAVWTQSDGTKNDIWANRYSASTQTWSGATLLEINNIEAGLPQIAMDNNGNAIAVWQQNSSASHVGIYANQYLTSTHTWLGAGTIDFHEYGSKGNTSSPQIAMSANGDAIVVWEQYDGTLWTIWSNFTNVITNTNGYFGEDARPLQSASVNSGRTPRIAMSANGDGIAVWAQIDNIWINRFTASTKSWSRALSFGGGNVFEPDVAMSDIGDAIVVWTQSVGTQNNIWANRYSASTQSWSRAFLLETNDIESAGNPQVAMSANGDAFVVWTQSVGSQNNIWANRYSASTQTWSGATLLVNDIAAESPKIAMSANGDAILVWGQFPSPTDQASLHIWAKRYSASTQTWSGANLIEVNNIAGAVSPQVAMSANGNAIAVWGQSDGRRYSIWANRTY